MYTQHPYTVYTCVSALVSTIIGDGLHSTYFLNNVKSSAHFQDVVYKGYNSSQMQTAVSCAQGRLKGHA